MELDIVRVGFADPFKIIFIDVSNWKQPILKVNIFIIIQNIILLLNLGIGREIITTNCRRE